MRGKWLCSQFYLFLAPSWIYDKNIFITPLLLLINFSNGEHKKQWDTMGAVSVFDQYRRLCMCPLEEDYVCVL